MARKKFIFALDGVLQLRRHEADQARRVLAGASQRCQEQAQRLQAAEQALQATAQPSMLRTLNPHQLRQHEAYSQQLKRERDAARRALRQCRQEEAKARQLVLERHRAEESLSTLRTSQAHAHRREQRQQEIRTQDEQTASRHSQPRHLRP
ncbi:MAG: flagellar FliJ family protein [Bacteroidota bacterium]